MAWNRAKRKQLAQKVRRLKRKVLVNYGALDAMRQGIAEGLDDFGSTVIERARPNVPDEPPIARGLVNTGGWATYIDGRKVGGHSTVRLGRKNPLKVPRRGIVLYVGYDFPAYFLEMGTVKMRARPFLTPAWNETAPELGPMLNAAIKRRMNGAPEDA